MKEREVRQDIQKQETRTPRKAARGRSPEQIPLQVLTQLLSGRTDLTRLSPPLLRVLAQSVGNSGLTELLRSGALLLPDLCTPEGPGGEEGLVPNEIRAGSPRLTEPAVWEGTGGWPQPASPASLGERDTV